MVQSPPQTPYPRVDSLSCRSILQRVRLVRLLASRDWLPHTAIRYTKQATPSCANRHMSFFRQSYRTRRCTAQCCANLPTKPRKATINCAQPRQAAHCVGTAPPTQRPRHEPQWHSVTVATHFLQQIQTSHCHPRDARTANHKNKASDGSSHNTAKNNQGRAIRTPPKNLARIVEATLAGRLRRYRLLRFKGWCGPLNTSGACLRTAGALGIGLKALISDRDFTRCLEGKRPCCASKKGVKRLASG